MRTSEKRTVRGVVQMEYIPTPEEQQEYLAYTSCDVFFENLENGIKELEQTQFERRQKKVLLIAGAMVVFDKGVIRFLNHMAEVDSDCQYVLLSEVTAEFRRKTRDMITFASICTPHLLAKEILVPYMDIPVSEEIQNYIDRHAYLKPAADNLNQRHVNIGSGYAEAVVYYADRYIRKLLEKTAPDCVLIWNKFYAFHMILGYLCEEYGIRKKYMEFGCVPGTFVIEEKGQQGESFPGRYPHAFAVLPVTGKDKITAESVIEYIFRNGLNRNPQPPRGRLFGVLQNMKPNRPVITYMGQNDYESGLYPYTEKTRKYHSPIFKSSLEALEFLRLLCIKNGWNLFYKPHPIIEQQQPAREKEEGVFVLEHMNIEEVIDYSDLIITILSQSAYIALFRQKPVVMLGYTQLKRSGCVYEAFSRRAIESAIKEALKKGFSEKQRKKFLCHVARELKYYLWDDGRHPEFPYGKKYKKGDVI